MPEEKLKPCPFCGSQKLFIKGIYVTCIDCQAEGPLSIDDQEEKAGAVKIWNKREPSDA